MRKFLLYPLLILLLVSAAVWWNLDRLTQHLLRPWLVGKIEQTLQAEISIDSLTFDAQRLLAQQLHLVDQHGIEVRIAEIELRYRLGHLLRQRLGELIVRQPEVRIEPARFDKRPPGAATDLPERAPLRIDSWSLDSATLRLVLPDRQLHLREIRAHGSLGPDFSFATQALLGRDPAVGFEIEGRGQWRQGLAVTLSELIWDQQSLLPEEVTFRPGRLADGDFQLAFDRLESSAAGALLMAAGQATPWPEDLSWQLTAPDLSVQWSTQEITLQVTAQSGSLETAASVWRWRQLDLQATGLDEEWHVAATIDLAGASRLQASGQWRQQAWQGEAQLVSAQPAELVRQLPLEQPAELARIGSLSVQTRFRATTGEIETSQGQLTVDMPGLGRLQGSFGSLWQGGGLTGEFDRLTFTTPAGRPLAEAAFTFAGNPVDANWQGEWLLNSAEPALLAGRAGFALPAAAPRLTELALAGKLAWQDSRLALSGVSLRGILSGAGLSAELNGRFDLQAGSQEVELTLQPFSLEGIEYANAGGTVAATGGSLKAYGTVQFEQRQIKFNLQGESSFSEALLGGWYGELSELPLNFSARGYWDISAEGLRLDQIELDLASLAAVVLQGGGSSAQVGLQGRLEIARLEGAFQQALQRLGADLFPAIDRLTLAGAISAEADFAMQAQDWSVKLQLQPEDMTVAWDDALRLSGLRGRLPLQLQQGDSLPVDGIVAGTLAWDRLDANLIETVHATMQMEASANRWRLTAPLTATVAGGTIHLNKLQIAADDLEPIALASVEVSGLDLTQLAEAFGWPEISGRLNASLEDVRISRAEIVTDGKAMAEAFGGSFQLGNLKIEAPFSRFPTYHVDVDFRGLELAELTRTFEFGEINGTADGFVHGLRLFDGIPSAFEARFETRSEGTRNISVKAIRNLNALSQGGLSAALSQGIYQFIDFYRYRKIGLRCTLRNDQFHITGLARPDSDRYLVDGSFLPPRIDVVISSPTISFREMVQRLQRIERTER